MSEVCQPDPIKINNRHCVADFCEQPVTEDDDSLSAIYSTSMDVMRTWECYLLNYFVFKF
jgi:hypothetical protein